MESFHYECPLVLHKGAGLERKGEEGLMEWKQRLFRISM